jgi:hypothetical protein
MCKPKEPNFFVDEGGTWSRGISWYESLFAGASSEVAVGEASTRYSMDPRHPGVAERLAGVVPEARIIYLIRHPIDRIVSMYRHRVDRGEEPRPIDEAVLACPDYVDYSRYAHQLRFYVDRFPREQIHVMTNEQLDASPTATMRGVLDFLGIDGGTVRQPPRVHTGASKRSTGPVPDRLRATLRRSGITRSLPRGVRGRLWRTVSQPIPDTATALRDETVGRIWEALGDDDAALRALLGPELVAWAPGSPGRAGLAAP